MKINWYPGHMAKTKRIIKEKLPLIDIVFEVIDARIPFSSKISDIDALLKNKPRLLIMTKYDLCDVNETQKWIKYYENKGYHVLTLNLMDNNAVDSILPMVKNILADWDLKRKAKGLLERSVRALIVGIPNVGKSTLINRLTGKKAVQVANLPGVTKSLDWIRINKDFELLDSPGILWPKFEDDEVAFNLASLDAIKEQILPLDDVCTYIIKKMMKYYPNALKTRYNLDQLNTDDIIAIYDFIGQKRGCLIKGGEVDYKKVFTLIKKDLNDGSLGLITFDCFESRNAKKAMSTNVNTQR